jgi:uncharacterized protein (DUF983 family)
MTAEHAQPAGGQTPTWNRSDAAQALWRGFRGCCPACGEGRMFRAFLKPNDQCPHCGEELYHHRADDFPAYLVIVIVGHIVVPLMLLVETEIAPALWVIISLWSKARWSPSNGLAACTASSGQSRRARKPPRSKRPDASHADAAAFSFKCGKRSLNNEPG